MKHLKNQGCYCILSVLPFLLLTACTPYRKIVYFQDLKDTTKFYVQDSIRSAQAIIQPADVMDIYVSSASPQSSTTFNLGGTSSTGGEGASSSSARGYTVYSDSCIEYPILGKVKAAGLTPMALKDTLTRMLNDYLKDPVVNIQFLNYKVTVLGEVARPAAYTISDGHATLLDLLGKAGDLTIYGRRDNITVIREENGKRTFARLDLTSSKVFLSPYYYLKQNDIVYVQPNKSKSSTADDRLSRNLGLGAAILAILLTLIYLTK
jgi:polysaccharide export outer membrane protein